MKFDGASGTLALASGSTLTTSSNGGILFTGTGTFDINTGTLTTSGTDFIVNQYSTGTATIDSVISGSSKSLTLAGIGAVVLTGANTYTGGTYIDGNLVQVSADANLGAATGTLTIQGGTLDAATGFASSRNVVLGADGGTFQVDSGTLTLNGTIAGGSAGSGASIASALTKTGAGTLLVNGNNTGYYGSVTISAGTLQLGSATALGNTSSGTLTPNNRSYSPLLVNGGSLDINGQTTALGNITLASGSIVDSGATPGTLTGYSFNLESGTVGAALVDDPIPGQLSNSVDLYKTTSGTVILTGNNSYTGATQISDGTLQIGDGHASGTLGTANVTLGGALPAGFAGTVGSGTLAFDRSDSVSVANAITGTGDVVQMGTGSTTLTGTNSYTGNTNVNKGTLVISSAGSITNTTGTLSVKGGATLAGLGTSSTRSFSIQGDNVNGPANVLVGHIAGDSNTTGVFNLAANGGVGTIAAANLEFNLSAGTNAGNEVSIGASNIAFGTISTVGTTLTLNLQGAGNPSANNAYILFAGNGTTTFDGTGLTSGQYAGLTLDLSHSVTTGSITTTPILNSGNGAGGALTLSFGSLNGTYGNGSYLELVQNSLTGADDIEVQVVPEPQSWALGLSGLALLVFWQRRKGRA